MELHKPILLFFFIAYLLLSDHSTLMSRAQLLPIVEDHGDEIKTYIVYVARPEGVELLGHEDLKSWHQSFLPNTTLDSGAPRLVYSYRDAISGFAARLTPNELAAMESMDGFVYARPDQQRKLLTTHTPKVLGLSQFDGVWSKTLLGEGIIIGVLDTGILPTHPSFNDKKMPPPPIKWKGNCSYRGFHCNNKILGAKAFNQGTNPSPIDDNGHGTHVASTAAGSLVNDASVLGRAKGKASGMAPKAHLAIYKVCFEVTGCMDADILAAIDQAISDGVDIISMSISGDPTAKYYDDPIALGSLAAIEKGISAVAAAGNDGPGEKTLNHDAPWVVTVGATSTDRRAASFVKLGNGEELDGESAYQPSSFNSSILLPIIFPGKNGDPNGVACLNGSLDYIDVRGKVVLCWTGEVDDISKGRVVDAAGGAGMILMNQPQQGYTTFSEAHVLPISYLSFTNGRKIRDYFYSTTTPTASIVFKGTRFGHRPSPALAYFSSRGPSKMNGGILKPDVLAPGVNILAAWPTAVGPHPSPFATKTFNFESGTSMATPHVSGIIALIKSSNPRWSPAAIQSAIVTSAVGTDLDGNIIVDETNNTANIFSIGAGQVNASGAMDPGLIYDANPNDYIAYLCGLGYSDAEVTATARRQIRCSTLSPIGANDLNYPSIAGSLTPRSPTQTFTRTVTNVGDANSVYVPRITEPVGVRVDISDYVLRFSRVGQQKSFTVQLTLKSRSPGQLVSSAGKLEWVSNKHVVTSPIAVSFA